MMQLATSQRPHPPPVPPRPSRQVVAEALKRSPRPPCPTRQAPPPPNTRPWRSKEQETISGPIRVGRTIVYESVKELQNGEKIRSSSEPPDTTNQTSECGSISPRRRSNDATGNNVGQSKSESNIGVGKTSSVTDKIEERCGGTRPATSERNEAENHRERQNKPQRQQQQAQQPQRRSNDNDLCDWKNSTARLSENDADIHSRMEKRSLITPDKIIINEESENIEMNMIDRNGESFRKDLAVQKIFIDETKTLKNNIFRASVDDDLAKNYDKENTRQLDIFTYENITKSIEGSTDNHNDSSTMSETSSSMFSNKSDDQRETRIDTRVPNTPTKNEKRRENVIDAREKKEDEEEVEEEEPIGRLEMEESVVKSGSTTTISSDDGATVVVIDEPERKIAFNEDNDNIHHQDWLEAGIRYSSTKITLPGDDPGDRNDEFQNLNHDDDDDNLDVENEDEGQAYADLDFSSIRERIAMSSLQGLPPLPRSLSGFNLNEGRREAGEPPPPPARSSSKTPKNVKSTQPSSSRPSPQGRQLTTLDTQLAILRKEMFGLRQLDLSLLSQLWSLNESIQEFRQLLQEQEDRAPSPSPSSEEGDDTSYGSHPPPPPRRPAPLLHHHRPPRPPRPLRPSASDESPSSEEYGAV